MSDDSITRQDIICLTAFLNQPTIPRLTNGEQVRAFEEEFAEWLGVKYAVMVNSGSSANTLTMMTLRSLYQVEVVLVPCIGWVSDVAAVLHAGMRPIFVDVDPTTLGMNWYEASRRARGMEMAIFPTHCLGFNAITGPLPHYSANDKLYEPYVVEDCCESIGGIDGTAKLGTRGIMSNFSFYFAHHMTTVEGGMVCTDNEQCYETLRRLRSHGLVREMRNAGWRNGWADDNLDLDPQFIFTEPAHNMRPTELNAVLGRSQLKRLDACVASRTENLLLFLKHLDASRYRVNYRTEGSSNYALPLILVNQDAKLFLKVITLLRELGVEYRKGTAGGGNQLRQPYAKDLWGEDFHREFPEAEHISDVGLYIGNYPGLDHGMIVELCSRLNHL
jgi:CDP-6-deoxy-D-xylo-4-hexulose-3-dehydrase